MKYETPDIWTASALFSQGNNCKVEKIGQLANGRNKFLFIFETETPEDEEQLKIRIEKIVRGEMNVHLETMKKSYKTLKNLTY